jgi:hypothetical protein
MPPTNQLADTPVHAGDILARKPYQKPGIVHELRLETRAGSTTGMIGLNWNPVKGLTMLDPNRQP